MRTLPTSGNSAIQAFPLTQGKLNLTSGSGLKGTLIYCAASGGFTITFNDENTEDITAYDGDIFALPEGSSIEITSGTFHLSK